MNRDILRGDISKLREMLILMRRVSQDMSADLCYYCMAAERQPDVKHCKKCAKELRNDKEAFLKNVIAKLAKDIEAFTVLSANPAPYRISKNSGGDDYAKTKFTAALITMQQKRGEILSELGLNEDASF